MLIEKYAFHWIAVADEDRSRLGMPGPASTMGEGGMLDEEVPDCQYRIRIVVGPVDIQRYLRFTPQGEDLPRLVDWVRAFVDRKLDWELELRIEAQEAPSATVGGPERLRWSGWLGKPPEGQPITGMRFEPEHYMNDEDDAHIAASIADDAPCGPDLEYDPEFVVLSAQFAMRREAQYGDFVGAPPPVAWSDVERDCLRLLVRSKDMRLAIFHARCRTRRAGAAGLAELRAQRPDALQGFDAALASPRTIDAWCRVHLDDACPDLAALSRLLEHIVNAGTNVPPFAEPAEPADAPPPADTPTPDVIALDQEPATPVPIAHVADDRHAALRRIREVRGWFEEHEPGSPISVLLRRAEFCVGKRYTELTRAVPPELIEQWEREGA